MLLLSPIPAQHHPAAQKLTFGEAPVQVARLKTAERFFEVFTKGFFQHDVRKMNMSLPDWASRFITLFSIYIPQAYLTIKNKKHPWEMNTRNVLTWTLTVLLTAFVKSDKTSLNTLFNVFMQPRRTPAELLAWKHSIWTQLKNDTQNKYGPKNGTALAIEPMREKLAEIRTALDALKANPTPEAAKELVAKYGPETFLKDHPEFSALRPVLDKLEELSDTTPNRYNKIRRQTIRSMRRSNREFKKTLRQWHKFSNKIQKLEGKTATLAARHGEDYAGGAFHRIINRFRLKKDYYRILNHPEIGLDVRLSDMLTAPWSKFDSNQFRHIQNKLKDLLTKKATNASALTPIERDFVEIMPKFMLRMNAFKLISSFVFVGLQAYLLGYAVMKFVNNTFARLDPDFDLNAKTGGKPGKTPAWMKRFEKFAKTKQASSQPTAPAVPVPQRLPQPVTNPFGKVAV